MSAEAERLRSSGRRYQAVHAEWRRRERQDRARRKTVHYRIGGVTYSLAPGQRLILPLTDGGTLTLCGEEG